MLLTKKTYKKREELKVKKLLPYCLIALLAISLVACKGNGGGSSSNSSTTTPTTNTPLQGSWRAEENDLDFGGGVTADIAITYAFAGNVVTDTYVITTNIPAAASPTGVAVTTTESFAAVGTFRLDGNNLYTTFKTASYSDGTQTLTDISAIESAMGGSGSLPVQVDNAEHLFGTYAVNGNILTLTPTGQSAANFTKQ